MGRLEFKGVPEPSRDRKLHETVLQTEGLASDKLDAKPPVQDSRDLKMDKLLKKLAATYIKGNKLLKGLGGMEPAQSIPIEDGADSTAAAADRFDADGSLHGKVITYSMFQRAVDTMLGKKWEFRKRYFLGQFPVTPQVQHTSVNETLRGKGPHGLIEEFLDQNGIAGTILAMLTLSPFQGLIFQSLTPVESGSKTAQAIQIPVGIAILIEMGIKAERIYDLLKKSKISYPLVEEQLVRMKDPAARREALSTVGIDRDQLKTASAYDDAQAIIEYTNLYYNRYGGLLEPGSHLTLDHWLAYLHVAQHQQYIRGALNTADSYSTDFSDIMGTSNDQSSLGNNQSQFDTPGKKAKLSTQLAGAFYALREKGDKMYDDILDSFMSVITDRDLCCLVQLFGAVQGTDMLKTIATLLRILAVDLSGEFTRLQNLLKSYLSNLFTAAILELVADLDKLMQKVMTKVVKTFTIDLKGADSCVGMLSIGYALVESLKVIYMQIKELIKELLTVIGDYGEGKPGVWTIAADRRHLLGTARILEVLAARLDVANACARDDTDPAQLAASQIEFKDAATFEAVTSILSRPAPTLQLSNQEIEKYFPDRTPKVSSTLGFAYGIEALQNSKTDKSKCRNRFTEDQINELVNKLTQVQEDTL